MQKSMSVFLIHLKSSSQLINASAKKSCDNVDTIVTENEYRKSSQTDNKNQPIKSVSRLLWVKYD